MTIPIRQSLVLACLAIAVGLPLSPGAFCQTPKASPKAPPKASPKAVTAVDPAAAATTVSPTTARSAALSAAVKQYKAKPDPYSWDGVWRIVRDTLGQPATVKASAASIVAAYPALSELGVSIIDGEGSRIWAFPKIAESQNVVLQWSSSVATAVQRPVGRRHRMVSQVMVTTVPRTQVLLIPPGIVLNDAHLVRGSVVGADKKPVPSGIRSLVLTGNLKGTGAVWLQAYKVSDNTWVETGDVFSAIPPFLTQNLLGKASFSGNDLVLTVGGGKSSTGKAQPQSSGYKIVLHFVDGRFSLDARTNEEGPALVALQFVQAVQQGHLDLAKGWLTDPRLLSIPKYIGLNRSAGQPFKIIAMANPGSGLSRFRLMTFDKDDLIMDVGKVKSQWAIKALFIAPPDPLAQKLVGTLPSAEKAAEPKASEESNK